MTSGLWARRASRLLHPAIVFSYSIKSNGQRWIRTIEASCSRFTVCPLWPLGNLPIIQFNIKLYKADDRTRTDNLLITNQLLCQLSHIGIILTYCKNLQMTPTGIEPVLPPWKGDVLTAWPRGHTLLFSLTAIYILSYICLFCKIFSPKIRGKLQTDNKQGCWTKKPHTTHVI